MSFIQAYKDGDIHKNLDGSFSFVSKGKKQGPFKDVGELVKGVEHGKQDSAEQKETTAGKRPTMETKTRKSKTKLSKKTNK